MNILLPTTITADMFGSDTNIPAVDTGAGEVAWASGTDNALGERRVHEGYIWECVQAVTGAPQNTYAPDLPQSAAFWLKDVPSNRMAPFDEYLYTAAVRAGEIRYVLTPGFFDGVWLGGVDADDVQVDVYAGHGGALLYQSQREMWAPAFGEWEYLFGDLRRTTKHSEAGLPIYPAGELDVRLTRNNPAVDAKLGMMIVGQWHKMLAPESVHGGTQYGAEVTPKSYSYFKRNEDGTYTRRRGRTAKNITASVLIDAVQAPRVASLLERILDVPVAVEANNLPRYGHISTVGFVTGTVTASAWGLAQVDIKVDGNI